MKHIAVIFRGHVRTWEYNYKTAFDFYDSIADNVDYYFVTWQMKNFYGKSVIDSFENNNKRLIKFLDVYDEAHYNSWKGPSWLNYSIIPYKLQREREVKYDAVFDTRPDIIYEKVKYKAINDVQPNTLYTTGFVCQMGPDNKRHIGVEDHFFMSSSEVHNRMNTRHVYVDDIGCQAKILEFAKDERINVVNLDWVNAAIVRPNTFISKPDPKTFFELHIDPRYKLIGQNWIDMTSDEKLAILQQFDIRIEDYQTNSITAKI